MHFQRPIEAPSNARRGDLFSCTHEETKAKRPVLIRPNRCSHYKRSISAAVTATENANIGPAARVTTAEELKMSTSSSSFIVGMYVEAVVLMVPSQQ